MRIVVSAPSITNTIYVVDDEIAGFVNQAIDDNVLANDSDPEGDTLQEPLLQTLPEHGVVDPFNADGSFTYTPDPDYAGGDSFTYRLCDDGEPQACDEAAVSVTIDIAANLPPVAVDDAAYTRPGQSITIDVLANDIDLDGELVTETLAISGAVSSGVATVANGVIDYAPDADFVGEVRFAYSICDDGQPPACDTATVTISIGVAPNLPPIAVDDNVATLPNRPVEIAVLANDTDPDGSLNPLSVTLVISPTHGQTTCRRRVAHLYADPGLQRPGFPGLPGVRQRHAAGLRLGHGAYCRDRSFGGERGLRLQRRRLCAGRRVGHGQCVEQ